MKRFNLLIDADDTLWHNNVYYEQGIIDFVDALERLGFSREETEQRMRRREMENVRHQGYGSRSFTVSLTEVYMECCRDAGLETDGEMLQFIEKTGASTRDYPIQFLEGVENTLPRLAGSHRLILLTKGVQDEQMAKVERSGVSSYFESVVVVPEKNEKIYRQILQDYGLHPEITFMVGNSPRSDINPAKAAGLRTVFIPYHATWEFEVENIHDQGHETITLNDFSQLEGIFTGTEDEGEGFIPCQHQ